MSTLRQEALDWLEEVAMDQDVLPKHAYDTWVKNVNGCETNAQICSMLEDLPNDLGIDTPNWMIQAEIEQEPEPEIEESKLISLSKAKELLTKLRKEDYMYFFNVHFIKRTTSEYRKMTCRYGVTKHLAGGELSFVPEDHQLKIVWDKNADNHKTGKKGDYRSIALEGLVRLKIKGQVYIIEENKHLLEKD